MNTSDCCDEEDGPEAPVDLGWANGWPQGTLPDLVRKCQEAKHVPVETLIGVCAHAVACNKCGYIYRYDSGD